MRDIVVGIGNPIVSDDVIGIYVAQRLKSELKGIEILEASFSGLYLLDLIVGYERAILIDSIRTGKANLGDVKIYQLNDFEKSTPFGIHSTDILSAIEMAKNMGVDVPPEIYFIVIEIEDNYTFSEFFTDKIEALKDEIYEKVKKEIYNIII